MDTENETPNPVAIALRLVQSAMEELEDWAGVESALDDLQMAATHLESVLNPNWGVWWTNGSAGGWWCAGTSKPRRMTEQEAQATAERFNAEARGAAYSGYTYEAKRLPIEEG